MPACGRTASIAVRWPEKPLQGPLGGSDGTTRVLDQSTGRLMWAAWELRRSLEAKTGPRGEFLDVFVEIVET